MGSTGSVSLTTNDFTLTADGLGAEHCLFAVSMDPSVPPVPFSLGWRCIASICRLQPPLPPVAGSASRYVPVTEYSQLQCGIPNVGSSFYYQCFYRVSGSFDTTDALVVTFTH